VAEIEPQNLSSHSIASIVLRVVPMIVLEAFMRFRGVAQGGASNFIERSPIILLASPFTVPLVRLL